MRLELAVAKRERDFYLQKVEQAKQIEKMAERRAAEAAGVSSKNDIRLEGPPLDREETNEEREAREAREKRAKRDEREFMLRRFISNARRSGTAWTWTIRGGWSTWACCGISSR